MPGSIPEEAGSTARSLIDAMRSQPLMLAVIALNAIIFVLIFYAVVDNRKHQYEVTRIMLEQNAKAIELLSKCVVPNKVAYDVAL